MPDTLKTVITLPGELETLTTADGSPMHIIGHATITLHLKNLRVTHHFIVVKSLMTDVILGIDFQRECERWQPDLPTYYCFGCIVDFVVLLFYLVGVDRSGSLSGGAFNQLKLVTLSIVLTILYLLKTVLQRSLLQCLDSLYKSDEVF